MENHHRILHIRISLGSHFQFQSWSHITPCFNKQLQFFGINMLPKKNTSGQKFKKMNVTIESLILKLV